jgi:YidC/Oxa1 family membrane protein insertase
MNLSLLWNTLILTPMVNVLIWIYDILFNNFDLAIILFTVLIRLITYPLTAQQMKSQAKMQELNSSNKMKEIQKKYKDDKQKQQEATMALYKEMGINPLGGCLPLFIQFPIMIGLYQSISLALAQAPIQLLNLTQSIAAFLPAAVLIPLDSKFLWLNLALPESQTPIFGITLPILNIGIPILTIIVVVTTWLQSKIMTPASTNPNDQSTAMARQMNLFMPIMMGWISWTLSSGLALYFIVSNLLGILQYSLLGKVDWRNLLPNRAKPAKAK